MSIWDNYFVFDGVDSRTFGAIAFFNDVDSSPIKEYTTSVIPGRSGDFLLNDRRFANIAHVYDVVIPTNFETNYANLRAFLLSRDGYCRLEDNSHPDEFYQAYFSEQIKPRVSRDRDIGRFQITFNRKPQRWLKSGEEEITIYGNGTDLSSINNPTHFASRPVLHYVFRYGYAFHGDVDINSTGIRRNTAGYPDGIKNVFVDFDTLQTYGSASTDSENYVGLNKYVDFIIPSDSSKAFALSPGDNSIVWTYPSEMSNITAFSITPRWYTI